VSLSLFNQLLRIDITGGDGGIDTLKQVCLQPAQGSDHESRKILRHERRILFVGVEDERATQLLLDPDTSIKCIQVMAMDSIRFHLQRQVEGCSPEQRCLEQLPRPGAIAGRHAVHTMNFNLLMLLKGG